MTGSTRLSGLRSDQLKYIPLEVWWSYHAGLCRTLQSGVTSLGCFQERPSAAYEAKSSMDHPKLHSNHLLGGAFVLGYSA